MTRTGTEIEQLREIVELHDVRYEVRPHEDVVKFKNVAERVKTGFDLELYGTHDHGLSNLTPGCESCLETYRQLRRIAEWILPKEQRPSVYEIEPFDQSLYSARAAKPRFEVKLRIGIRHRDGWDLPIDECEKQCLDEMRVKLGEIGIRQR